MPTVPPPLPSWLADPALAVMVGTGLWFVASATLLAAFLFGGRALDEWFWTTTAGWILGLAGYSILRWQRHAARRGSRSAQDGV